LQHDAEQAVRLLEKSLILFREQGDKLYIGLTLLTLGAIVLYQGDLPQAETCAQESLTHLRAIGGPYKTALALRLLGDVRRMQGDLTQARTAYKEGLSLAVEIGNRFGMGRNLIGLARVAAAEGQLEQAVCLFGIAEPLFNPRVDFHPEMDPFECTDYECVVESVRTQLGAKAFMAAWNKGQNLTPEQILASLGSMPLPIPVSPVCPLRSSETAPALDGLTPREMDVLRQLAQGLTSAEIADRLVISVVTVNFHVRSIYSKIGVNSRAAATRYAMEHGLV
jgi:DNA-binding CsgD family transcriptional regulator/tetratricopeptide (TPR) repeat protein